MAIAMSLSIVGADRAGLGHVSQSALSMLRSIDFSAVAQKSLVSLIMPALFAALRGRAGDPA